MRKHPYFILWLILWLIAALSVLCFTNGIGDNGDGLMHYMFARYAHLHPDNFLDPWAKTGFTLVAFPFAQLGLIGMKLLNILVTAINMWLVFKLSSRLGIKYPLIASIVLGLSTSYFILMYSGLTEHVFSFVLLLSIYLLVFQRWMVGTLILSTLPFFRQEGYIMIAALLPFYLTQKKIKFIPLLATSFVIIGMIGAIRYQNPGWIIQSNPYSQGSYGKGSIFTFFHYLYYHHGLVNLVFFVLGCSFLVTILLKKRTAEFTTVFLVIFLPFVTFFAAHALFWYLGIFHSMGLQRVLNGVVPLFAVLAALGFSKFTELFPSSVQKITAFLSGTIVTVFPLIPSPANIHFTQDFSRTEFEEKMAWTTRSIRTRYYQTYMYYEHPLVPYLMNMDPFDRTKCDHLIYKDLEQLQTGSIIFWENGLTALQSGYTEDVLKNNNRLTPVFESATANGKQKIVVFEVK